MDNKNSNISDILHEIHLLEKKLKLELEKEAEKSECKNGKICFDKHIKEFQKKYKKGLLRYIKDAPIKYILSAPIIYFLIFPAIILDISVSIYQAINFKIYGIKRVNRKEYIVFDRQYLSYLNIIEKINCLYCSYFNGLIAYVGEIAAKTEQFWCPIRHAKNIAYRHSTYANFISYGDGKKFREELKKLRKDLK